MNVLILEDDPFVSMDACDTLNEIGLMCLAAYDCSTAARILRTCECELALLDYDLNGETSLPVAKSLADRGIPYGFVTGRSIEEVVGDSGLTAPIFRKPANYKSIAETMLSAA